MEQYSISNDAEWGAKRGLGIACIYCLWVSLVYVTNGPQAFERHHVTYATVIATYILTGLVSGTLIGTLRRFTRSRIGSYSIGLAAGIPLAFGIMTSVRGLSSNWQGSDWTFLLVIVVTAGLVIGSELDKRRKGDLLQH